MSSKKYRITKQCRIILDRLCYLNSHPTAIELYNDIKEIIPNISLGTIYRNLEKLRKQKKIIRFTTGDNNNRFDANLSDHLHIRCIKCDKIKDIYYANLIVKKLDIKEQTGFDMVKTHIEITGICSSCRS